MKINVVLPVIGVAIANVAMNFLMSSAAAGKGRYLESLRSPKFFAALIVGIFSALALLYVYSFKINLAQGVLLMGAASIVGGSLFGVVVIGNRLALEEWVLLVLIALLFAYRWMHI